MWQNYREKSLVMFPDIFGMEGKEKEKKKNKGAADSVLQRLEYCDWIKTWIALKIDTELQEMGLC